IAVLNTTSATDRPGAPTETPSKIVPSSSARSAVGITGFAYVGGMPLARTPDERLQQSANAAFLPVRAGRWQASRDCTDAGRFRQTMPPVSLRRSAQQVGDPVARGPLAREP